MRLMANHLLKSPLMIISSSVVSQLMKSKLMSCGFVWKMDLGALRTRAEIKTVHEGVEVMR